MAVKKENLEVDSAAARGRPIELITENGFSIVRTGESEGTRRAPQYTFVFIVRDQQGSESEITVEIDQHAAIEITHRSWGRVSKESSYWICCAERHLADYLWEEDSYPPEAKLTVAQLTLEDLNLANRWGRP
jgi:hypothetical protein